MWDRGVGPGVMPVPGRGCAIGLGVWLVGIFCLFIFGFVFGFFCCFVFKVMSTLLAGFRLQET